MSNRTPVRHGEILLMPIDSAPEGNTDRVTSCIVGHSESGHHHVLEGDAPFARIVASTGDLLVDLDMPTPLRHRKSQQQHRELLVPAGAWRVVRKTEFDVRAMRDEPEVADVSDPLPRPERAPMPRPRTALRWVRD
jgi:hypothetical protein